MVKPNSALDAAAFAERLVNLLARNGIKRHGAGAYLRRRYDVSGVTANAWLNGEHKCDIATARRIAEDHGATFDDLYWDIPPAIRQITDGAERYDALRPDQVAMLELWEGLDADDRRRLQAVGNAFSQQDLDPSAEPTDN